MLDPQDILELKNLIKMGHKNQTQYSETRKNEITAKLIKESTNLDEIGFLLVCFTEGCKIGAEAKSNKYHHCSFCGEVSSKICRCGHVYGAANGKGHLQSSNHNKGSLNRIREILQKNTGIAQSTQEIIDILKLAASSPNASANDQEAIDVEIFQGPRDETNISISSSPKIDGEQEETKSPARQEKNNLTEKPKNLVQWMGESLSSLLRQAENKTSFAAEGVYCCYDCQQVAKDKTQINCEQCGSSLYYLGPEVYPVINLINNHPPLIKPLSTFVQTNQTPGNPLPLKKRLLENPDDYSGQCKRPDSKPPATTPFWAPPDSIASTTKNSSMELSDEHGY